MNPGDKWTKLRWLTNYSASGPSPTCEDRVIEDPSEWGILKTTAISWKGWNYLYHKTLPHLYWGLNHLEIKAGDVLVTKAGPRHRVGVAAYVDHVAPRIIASGKMVLLRTRSQELDPRYLSYFIATPPAQTYLNACKTGMAEAQMNFSNEDLLNLRIPIPNIESQKAIADFLDTETSRIDHMNNLRIAQMRLLKQRPWSYFQSLIDRNQSPEIPLRRVIETITDGPFGSAFSSNDYTDEGAIVIRLGNIGFATYRTKNQAHIPMSMLAKFDRYKVVQGDLLIAALGDAKNHAGRACVAPDLGPAIVKGKCLRARVDPRVADAEFIAILLSSPIGESAVEGHGSTRTMINIEIVKSAILPMPSKEEQSIIVQEFRNSWHAARNTIEACQRQIKLITERRQALITAAVTGQFDVSTASGRGVEVS